MRPRQLNFAFADSPRGGKGRVHSDVSEGKRHLLRIAERRKADGSVATEVDTSRLLEKVASESNLAQALLNVARNEGAPGVDGKSVTEVVGQARRLLPALSRALLDGVYRPGDIRRVWIPKPGGGQRGLGIPNVVDRWVQQAVYQVMEPIFEPSFHSSSHGFRPGRGAHTAIAEATGYIATGHTVIVDMDISKFFDHVNHQRLLDRLGRKIADARVLKLVNSMLKAAVVMPEGTKVQVHEGTPQGGPLSPLLSNVVLDELDAELKRRKLLFVRYADDCNIFVRSERAGQRVLASIGQFLEQRLRLRLNPEKSAVRRPEDTHFLGFCFRIDREHPPEIELSSRSRKRLAVRILELTPRNFGNALSHVFSSCNRYLRGWVAYFRICTGKSTDRVLGNADSHIRRRIRAIIVRQAKRPGRLARRLRKRGVTGGVGGTHLGCWARSVSSGMNRGYPNAWFATRLVSLRQLWLSRQRPRVQVSEQLALFPS